MLHKILCMIATIGIVGFMPIAPGTFGSAVSFLVVYLTKLSTPLLLVIFGVSFAIGTASSHVAEAILGKDSGHIVIDEFCGYLISVMFLPAETGIYIVAFFLFRAFDIVKPFPMRYIERTIPGGPGIMLDDLLAGIYTNLCLQVWVYIK